MSSVFSSYGSDSRPSGLSRSPLMKVPFELFTSLMYIFVAGGPGQFTRGRQRRWRRRGQATHLSIVLPNLCVLPAEHLGVEEAISFCGDGLCVGLAADLDALVADEGDVLGDERVVEGVEVERR